MNSSVNRRQQTGFTLLELMIVVFIISLLSMIAVPAYENNVVKTKIGAELSHFERIKIEMAVYYTIFGSLPASNDDLSLPAPEQLSGKYIEKITVQAKGGGGGGCGKGKGAGKGKCKGPTETQVVLSYNIKSLRDDNELIYTFKIDKGNLVWDCKKDTTIAEQYRPSICS